MGELTARDVVSFRAIGETLQRYLNMCLVSEEYHPLISQSSVTLTPYWAPAHHYSEVFPISLISYPRNLPIVNPDT